MPTFTKQERLKSRKTIARLFKEGNSFVAYPLRVVWLEATSSPSLVNPTPDPSPKKEGRRDDDTAYSTLPSFLGEGSGVGLTREGVELAISVPKRAFKTAVARNRLKRRIREACRLHKEELYEKLGERRVVLMIMFIAKEELSYAEIEAGVRKMIRKFP